MRADQYVSNALHFGWWNKAPESLRATADNFIAQGNLKAAALILTRLEDPKAEAYGIASAFVLQNVPRIVDRGRDGERMGPDLRWAGSILNECRQYMKEGSASRTTLDAGAAALDRGNFDEALAHFTWLAFGHKDRWAHQLIEICATAPYSRGDIQGTIAAYKNNDMEPSAWRFQALELLVKSYLSFSGVEPSAEALAGRVQAALPVDVKRTVLVEAAEGFLKSMAEERRYEDSARSTSVELIDPRGTPKLNAGGVHQAFSAPNTAAGLFAASLTTRQRDPWSPAAKLEAALLEEEARGRVPAPKDPLEVIADLVHASHVGDHATYDARLAQARQLLAEEKR